MASSNAYAYYLSNNLYVQIAINGQDVNLQEAPIARLQLNSSGLFYLPQGQIVFVDSSSFFHDNISLGDGDQVVITIGDSPTTAKIYLFSIWTWDRHIVGNATQYTIDLLYGVPQWLATSMFAPFVNQSSSQVLQALARQVGLTFEGIQTSDFQTWYPAHHKLGKFARKVSSHGWSSDTSIMALAVSLQNKLLYKNIASKQAAQYIFKPDTGLSANSEGSQTPIYYALVEERIASGFNNVYSGYGKMMHQVDLTKDQKYGQLNKVNFSPLSQSLLVNQATHSGSNDGTRSFPPFLSGNVHANYNNAEYQNARGMALFNLNALVTLYGHVTDIDLLDFANLDTNTTVANSPHHHIPSSGKYVVWNKTIFIENTAYYEKFQLIRQGYDEASSTQIS